MPRPTRRPWRWREPPPPRLLRLGLGLLTAAVSAPPASAHANLPRRPAAPRERAVSSRVARALRVGEHARAAAELRQAHPQQLQAPLQPGFFKPLVTVPVYSWLSDAARTCLPRAPARKQERKLQAAAAASSGGASGAAAAVTAFDPVQFYAPEEQETIQIYDRDSPAANGGLRTVNCTQEHILDDAKRTYVSSRLIPKVLRQLSALLSPRYSGSGRTTPLGWDDASREACGGAYCFRCLTDHFLFDLPHPYRYPDADLMLFVTAAPDWAPAWATPCAFAADGRPSSIVLNVAPSEIGTATTVPLGLRKLQARVLQALFHALGFDPSVFPYWKSLSPPNYLIPAPGQEGHRVNVIASPAVRTFLETVQFRCIGHPKGGSGTLEGAELEDALDEELSVLPYWESRLFRGELMTMLPDLASDLSTDLPVLSGLTLAAMEDTGWYAVNKKLASRLPWLFEQPCSVARQPCSQWPARYRCPDGAAAAVCSPDFTSLAACNGIEWLPGRVPERFRRYGGTARSVDWAGARQLMDFCAYAEADSLTGASCLYKVAGEPKCQTGSCPQFQVRGPTSRCFLSNVRYKKFADPAAPAPAERGTCLPHQCTRVGVPAAGQPQQWSVRIWVAGAEYVCDGSRSHVGPSAANAENGTESCAGERVLGLIRCPDPRELCEEAGPAVMERRCDPLEDCSAHGSCTAAGACSCFTELDPSGSPLYGMWAGTRCSRCHEDYTGEMCNVRRCPVDPDTLTPCFGNGECVGGACVCFANATHGWWSNATNCQTCAAGKTGGTCKIDECSTDVRRNTCGQGTCDAATLRCTCFRSAQQGFWAHGENGVCHRCVAGYDYGQSCKVRITNFFGCDTQSARAGTLDSIGDQECKVSCTPGDALPQRPMLQDPHGCFFSRPPPKCFLSQEPADRQPGLLQCPRAVDPVTNISLPRSGEPSGCTPPVRHAYDCQGYPNLYTDCWLTDECGCTSPLRIDCIPGTDARRSPDAFPSQIRSPGRGRSPGMLDPRADPSPTSARQCRCPRPRTANVIDCWGYKIKDDLAPSGQSPFGSPNGPYERGRIVLFEPHQFFEEDFCHCTSPPIPQCSDATKPHWLPERSQGKVLDCKTILDLFGCPNWHKILNVGRETQAGQPDLSMIDCDGWPPPKLHEPADPCGCPFPQFKCIPGTMGRCDDPPNCPKWDPLPAVDCLGQMPPVLNLHGPHPCGCPPPPRPTCIPGTERGPSTGGQCLCDSLGTIVGDATQQPVQCNIDDVEWVDCGGVPLEPPPWNPWDMYPMGDPWVSPCDPCPHCQARPPLRRCLPGTSGPRRRGDSPVELICRTFQSEVCIKRPPPCPVDCHGVPRAPEFDTDAGCECPPEISVPPCLPGTDGSPPELDVHPIPCESSPSVCGAYACGGGAEDVDGIAADLGLAGDYSTPARDAVRATLDEVTLVCVQEGQCSSHYHCATGFYCGVCGLCLPDEGLGGAPRGCLADAGASCGLYRCDIECDAEGVAQVLRGARDAQCRTRCYSDADCKRGAVCSRGAFAAPPQAGAAWQGRVQVVGGIPERREAALPAKGIPGFNPGATPPALGIADEPAGFVPLRDFGECVRAEADPSAAAFCTSHEQCGGYACGTANTQFMFALSRCLSTCYVSAHCHPDFKCDRSAGRCVAAGSAAAAAGDTLPDGPSCTLQPFDYCSPYWCGGDRGRHPHEGATCPSWCQDDDACQPFYECAYSAQADDVQSGGSAEAPCDEVTGRKLAEPAAGPSARARALDPPQPGRGRCVPTAVLARRVQGERDAEQQREVHPFIVDPDHFKLSPTQRQLPMLVVPVGTAGGYQDDPNSLRFLHAPFPPPAVAGPRPEGTAIRRHVAECWPYLGATLGVTADQVRQMREAARAGRTDPSTGRHYALPGCKTYCHTDADCAGQHFCTAQDPPFEFVAPTGERVVASGSGQAAAAAELGDQGEEVDPETRRQRQIGRAGRRLLSKGSCQALRGLGAACTSDHQCGSGHCSGNLCCNTACSLPCQTCERMGVCGWVAPHVIPGGRCPKCHWCEYVADPAKSTPVGPASALGCAPIPVAQDPANDCGAHGKCNGEGACLYDRGWAGEGCALGFYGPNCEYETVQYRTVAVQDAYSRCSAAEAAKRAQSPVPQGHVAAPSGTMRRSSVGLASVPQHEAKYPRRMQLVDRRPRQWARRVLGLSAHSQYGCSEILYEPSVARHKRRHRRSPKAWAPRGFVRAPRGMPDAYPELEYFPWVNCPNQTETSCANLIGCKWVPSTAAGGYCVGDGTVTAMPTAVRDSPLADKRTPDPALLVARQPLQWIELEFDSPVFIQTVIIHENFNPGSVVRIETQPALTGAAALAESGGGVLRTDANGTELPPDTVVAQVRGGETSPVTGCGNLTSEGRAICIADLSCFWQNGECREGVGSCSLIDADTCRTRERAELCWWDEDLLICRNGRRPGCYPLEGYDEQQAAATCGQYNDLIQWPPTSNRRFMCEQDQTSEQVSADGPASTSSAGTAGMQQCQWSLVKGLSLCNPDSGPQSGCAAAASGGLCLAPCQWNGTAGVCSEPSRGLQVGGRAVTAMQYCRSVPSAALCGPLNHCKWDQQQTEDRCLPLLGSVCRGSAALPQGDSARDTCMRLAPCLWVDPGGLPDQPLNGSVSTAPGCPELRVEDYADAVAVRYALRGGSNYEVELTCRTGYAQVGGASCRPGGYPLQGTVQCLVATCPPYVASPPLVVAGYTVEPPFAERQEGSRVLFECSGQGLVPSGSQPVCSGGAFVAPPPTMHCADNGTLANRTQREAEALAAPQRRPGQQLVQRRRAVGGGDPGKWHAPDHDYEALTQSLAELRQRWAKGQRHLGEGHRHHRVVKVLQGTAASDNASATSGTVTGSLRGRCLLDPFWEPSPAAPGEAQLNWAAICSRQVTEFSCVSDDDGAPPGTAGRRSGKCMWTPATAVSADTPIASPPTTPVEQGSWPPGVGDPKPFRLRDMGPMHDPHDPMPSKDQTKPTAASVACENLRPGTTINPNRGNWTAVWERPFPHFPARKRYREWHVDVGSTGYRSRAVRLWFSPISSRLSQIDAVAVVGPQQEEPAQYSGPLCKGEIWVSPLRTGTPTAAGVQSATPVAVPCSGRGRCGPRGCECSGNFFGEGCEQCKFGWAGPSCGARVRVGCRPVAFEDLSQFDDEDEVKARWRFLNYQRFDSRGVRWKHFGSELTSPLYVLGEHTHFQLDVGTLMVDVPLADDCGLVIGAAESRNSSDFSVIYTAGCEFFSGLNVVGAERGDKLGFFSVQRRWTAPTVVIRVEVWWGGSETDTFVFTLLNFEIKACMWTDTARGD
eukprot:TRINITY_DN6951_c0_g2_i1.p1 TRINITY_DN6951_c0_g2~~TRINITY_DN6951_c0_g2_i1.p1  ORF type:complete len:3312 (+),score=640.00 TRINITY_DN6951_c0_g2_i1:76-10011(+)